MIIIIANICHDYLLFWKLHETPKKNVKLDEEK